MADGLSLRSVAFYLPQFHPIPENDAWWGRGFTDWTNVVQGRPLFRGHDQPHLPSELGFYDLRVPEVREAQAELASQYGIDAFCYYHYWFEGRRLLQRPFDEVLASGRPDFPFCLCWANENWTRVWDGGPDEVLIAQGYSEQDDLDHIRWLAAAFADRRYLRVDGRPVFLVYRPGILPDPRRTTERWRCEAQRLGIGELYLCTVESHSPHLWCDPRETGFDAAVTFAPLTDLGPPAGHQLLRKAVRKLLRPGSAWRHNHVRDYRRMVELNLPSAAPYKRYPCVSPGWDNSVRRRGSGWATIFVNSSPQAYEHWVREVVRRFEPASSSENLLFVNAWNEWAEGNHMEPCQRWGRGFLEAHARALGRDADAVARA